MLKINSNIVCFSHGIFSLLPLLQVLKDDKKEGGGEMTQCNIQKQKKTYLQMVGWFRLCQTGIRFRIR